MKAPQLTLAHFWPLGLTLLSSCAWEPQVRESEHHLQPSRTAFPKAASAKTEPHDPWLTSQRMFDKSQHRPMLVGVHALKSWLGSPKLQVWNLCPEEVVARYAQVPGSIPIAEPSIHFSSAAKFNGTIVLVGHEGGQDLLNQTWRQLLDLDGPTVMLLSGGIESWANMMDRYD